MRILFFILCLFSLHATEVLWRGEHVSLIEEKGLPAIFIDRKISEMTDGEIIEFERTVAKMQNVFQKVFGFGDYTRWMPIDGEALTSYVIPAGAYTGASGVDYEIKIQIMLYTLKDRKEMLRPLTKEEIGAIQLAAREILPFEQPVIPLEDTNLPLNKILEGYVHALNELNLPCELGEGEVPPFKFTFTTKCNVFCNNAILDKQKSAQTDWNHILYNNRPYVDCHLMVVPSRHITNISELSDEEILDKFSLIAKIGRIAKEQLGCPNVGVATRIGWKGGQTQSHFHDHILGFDPKEEQPWIQNWVHDLMNNRIPIDLEKWEMNRLFWQECLTVCQ